ncbi:MAG: metallophosphoesterase, partial [Candidatus Eisenbacteria bacterium]|nr:metallophosphoesterase [Candidatus Eisenbacteria bacterium]
MAGQYRRALVSLASTKALPFVALALLTAWSSTAFSGEPEARLVTDPSDLLIGWSAEGQVGDFLLTNGEASFIIEHPSHPHGDGLTGGNVIDAGVTPFWEDEFGSQLTFLVAHPRQAVYDTVLVESAGGGEPAVLLARGHDSDNPDIEIETRYTLAADVRFLELETTLINHGAAVSGYSAGDALNWGDGTHFVPGYGFNVTSLTTYSSWIGAASTGPCYGYTKSAGTITTRHGDLWSDPTVYSGSIPSGGTAVVTRFFVAGGLGLASVSDVVHTVRGEPVGTVAGTVTDAVTGAPLPGTAITCIVGTATYTQAHTDFAGHYSATLFAGSYTFVASVPTYTGREETGSVSLSETTTVNFQLVPGGSSPEVGDTLTVVSRPILSVPTILTPGGHLIIEAVATEATTGWVATLRHGSIEIPLSTAQAVYESAYERWFITAVVPPSAKAEVYDLIVTADGGLEDEVRHSVVVRQSIDNDFYFIQVTDTHMPTHAFYYQEGADSDTTEMDDLRAVIQDVNLINPAFVLLTGDVVNEGELEDFLDWRSFTKAKRIMREFDVPVYIVAGNHDVGGWDSTPPPAGTSRRNWWKFFGWRRLGDPPPAEQIYTQNYTFDYGGAHFIGLEAYDNYDNWRHAIYGRESFTNRQLAWLVGDLSLIDPATPTIAFYHYDFGDELNLSTYGIDCGLWGHIHRDRGSITEQPFNLATRSCCDGGRAMRLIRVQDGQIVPSATIRAGSSGQNLSIAFTAPNDGTQTALTATVQNSYPETFEDGLVKFRVRSGSIPYKVDNGEVTQTIVEGDQATVYVNVPMAAGSATVVSLEPDTSWVN